MSLSHIVEYTLRFALRLYFVFYRVKKRFLIYVTTSDLTAIWHNNCITNVYSGLKKYRKFLREYFLRLACFSF